MSAQGTLIRPLAPGDRAQWAALWRAYLAFYETTVEDGIFDLTFARCLDPAQGDFHGLVAERGGQLVGLTHVIHHLHAWKRGKVCYLQDLYALPELRGQGIGRALIEAVYAHADAWGLEQVYWLTHEDNAPARRLYDRIGSYGGFVKYARPAP